MKEPLPMSGKGYKVHLLDKEDLEALGQKPFKKSFISGINDGQYFSVDIAADTGCETILGSPCKTRVAVRKIILFETGKYVMLDPHRYDKALDEFYANVAYRIETEKVDYRLFIIGEADALGDETFEDYFKEGFRYENICYMPKFDGSESLFIPKPFCAPVSEPFRNGDLPNLRARFFQNLLQKHKFLRVEILDGNVTAGIISAARRNVTLIMYVPKEFFKTE